MKFEPGSYYVGDPGFVLPNDDLRTLFLQSMQGKLKTGKKILVASHKWEGASVICEHYWLAKVPGLTGTLYDKDGEGWGIDYGCFGIVPWKWVTCSGSYVKNKIEFTELFECTATEEKITIGNLTFTFSPK